MYLSPGSVDTAHPFVLSVNFDLCSPSDSSLTFLNMQAEEIITDEL